jgi:hypothetical protein
MPIRPEFRHFYLGDSWAEARGRVLERAGHRCEQCHKPNREAVWTFRAYDGSQWWSWTLGRRQVWIDCKTGTRMKFALTTTKAAEAQTNGLMRIVRVVLTVAHLNHKPGDDRLENLKAFCQWCHLHYDKLHHHETRGSRKDAARPLLVMVR